MYSQNSPYLYIGDSLLETDEDGWKYPNKEELEYRIQQARLLDTRCALMNARKAMPIFRFIPKKKISIFSLVWFISDEKKDAILVYFVDIKTGKYIQLFTSCANWYASKKDYFEDKCHNDYDDIVEEKLGIKLN
jgi:hypothetical protein